MILLNKTNGIGIVSKSGVSSDVNKSHSVKSASEGCESIVVQQSQIQNRMTDPTSLLNINNPLSPMNITTGLINPASPFSMFKF